MHNAIMFKKFFVIFTHHKYALHWRGCHDGNKVVYEIIVGVIFWKIIFSQWIFK